MADEQKKIRSMSVMMGVSREIEFKCDDCGVALSKPVEKSAVYVGREGEPRLVCPKCVKGDDLYIWGIVDFLDDRDLAAHKIEKEMDMK